MDTKTSRSLPKVTDFSLFLEPLGQEMIGLLCYYLILVTYILVAQESMRGLNGLFVFWVKVGRIIPWPLKKQLQSALANLEHLLCHVLTCSNIPARRLAG